METLEIRHASAAQRHQLRRRGESNWNKANRGGGSQNMEQNQEFLSKYSDFKLSLKRFYLRSDLQFTPFTFDWEIDNGSNKSLSRATQDSNYPLQKGKNSIFDYFLGLLKVSLFALAMLYQTLKQTISILQKKFFFIRSNKKMKILRFRLILV